MKAWVGIDVSKRSLDVAVLVDREDRLRVRRFANDAQGWEALVRWVDMAAEDVHFVMESTGAYSYGLAAFLADKKWTVSVENPRFIKHWAIGLRFQNKTDKADARIIARYAKACAPAPWDLSDPILREIHLVLARLGDLDAMILAERNRLENPALIEAIATSIQDSIRAMEAQRSKLLELLQKHTRERGELAGKVTALVKEPAIGELTAFRVLSHFGWDPNRFQSAQQAAASIGLNPVKRESGTFKGKTCISKRGPRKLRGDLYMATVVAIRHNPRIKAFYLKLTQKGLPKMAALIACSRKLCMILYGILKAHCAGKEITYSGSKTRYTNLEGKQRKLNSPTRKPLTI